MPGFHPGELEPSEIFPVPTAGHTARCPVHHVPALSCDGHVYYRTGKQIVDFIKDNCPDSDFSTYTFGRVIEILKSDYPTKSIKLSPKKGKQEKYINDNHELFNYACSLMYEEFKTNYVTREQLTDDKTEEGTSSTGSNLSPLMKHLHKIEHIIRLYNDGKFNEFIRETDFELLNSKQIKLL